MEVVDHRIDSKWRKGNKKRETRLDLGRLGTRDQPNPPVPSTVNIPHPVATTSSDHKESPVISTKCPVLVSSPRKNITRHFKLSRVNRLTIDIPLPRLDRHLFPSCISCRADCPAGGGVSLQQKCGKYSRLKQELKQACGKWWCGWSVLSLGPLDSPPRGPLRGSPRLGRTCALIRSMPGGSCCSW
jgi:hypothetical protein